MQWDYSVWTPLSQENLKNKEAQATKIVFGILMVFNPKIYLSIVRYIEN